MVYFGAKVWLELPLAIVSTNFVFVLEFSITVQKSIRKKFQVILKFSEVLGIWIDLAAFLVIIAFWIDARVLTSPFSLIAEPLIS